MATTGELHASYMGALEGVRVNANREPPAHFGSFGYMWALLASRGT
jgi:hypothetical protein